MELTPRSSRPGRGAGGQAQDRGTYRLRERERFLRTLISNLPGIVYRCKADADWTLEFISDGVELTTLLGYSDKDFLESRHVTWDDVMHPGDRERVHTEVPRLAMTRAPFSTTAHSLSYRVVSATTQTKHVRDHFRFVDDETGQAVALEGVITDVTDLTLADARVRESDSRYRLLAENTNDLVCLHALDGRFLFVSPSCERVLGCIPVDLVGASPYPFIHPDDVTAIRDGVFGRLAAGEATVMSEHRMRHRSGTYVWLETLGQRVIIDGSASQHVLTSSRDITRRKIAELERAAIEQARAAALLAEQHARQEAELARHRVEDVLAETEVSRAEAVQANRAKDEFLQMVSHEFRTPLTTIKIAVSVLRRGRASEADWRQHLDTIGSECDRQIDMLVNLLDVSRLDEGSVDLRHEPVDMAVVLDTCDRVERSAAKRDHSTSRLRRAASLSRTIGSSSKRKCGALGEATSTAA